MVFYHSEINFIIARFPRLFELRQIAVTDKTPEQIKEENSLKKPSYLAWKNWKSLQDKDTNQSQADRFIASADNQKHILELAANPEKAYWNWSFSKADWNYWSRKSLITTEEAALLSFNLEPSVVNFIGLMQYLGVGIDFPHEVHDRYLLIKDAIDAGYLQKEIKAAVFINWAKNNQLELPEGFAIKQKVNSPIAHTDYDPVTSINEDIKDGSNISDHLLNGKTWHLAQACCIVVGHYDEATHGWIGRTKNAAYSMKFDDDRSTNLEELTLCFGIAGIYNLAYDSVMIGELNYLNKEVSDDPRKWLFAPTAFVEWCQSMGIDLRPQILQLLSDSNASLESKAIKSNSRGRTSLGKQNLKDQWNKRIEDNLVNPDWNTELEIIRGILSGQGTPLRIETLRAGEYLPKYRHLQRIKFD